MNTENLYQRYKECSAVCTDTRNILSNSIFFALKGESFDGNKFVKDALKSGAKYAVTDNAENSKIEGAIFVADTLQALQSLAAYHRKQLRIPVIGITGTNGKTTTKELIHSVLSTHFNCYATKGNLNNHIGVPLTLLSIPMDCEIAIIEMGANHPGEIAFLCRIADPEFGIITNIGKAHLEGFGSVDGVIQTKNELYKSVMGREGHLFCNGTNDILVKLVDSYPKVSVYGINDSYYVSGKLIPESLTLNFNLKIGKESFPVAMNLTGSYNLENALAAACIGDYFGVPSKKIVSGLENYIPDNNRSQLMKTRNNILIVDAYNANPSSMNVSIANFININAEKKCLIIGDMLELGSDSVKEHSDLWKMIRSLGFDRVYYVGPEFKKLLSGTEENTFDKVDELCTFLGQNVMQGFTILIKGSRGIRLEKTIPYL